MSPQRYERVHSSQNSVLSRPPVSIDMHQKLTQSLLQISSNGHDDIAVTPSSPHTQYPSPSSPPPSFRSAASSPSSRHLLSSEDPISVDADRTLADTFDDGFDSDSDGNNGGDDRQRLMRSNTTHSTTEQRVVHDGPRPDVQRMITQLPTTDAPPGLAVPLRPTRNSSSPSNDGVFANLNAKPERGEKLEEQPPVGIFLLQSTLPSC